jgi:hypothetical protein
VAYGNRLDQTEYADGSSQFVESFLVKIDTGLERICLDHIHRDAKDVRLGDGPRTCDFFVDVADRLP